MARRKKRYAPKKDARSVVDAWNREKLAFARALKIEHLAFLDGDKLVKEYEKLEDEFRRLRNVIRFKKTLAKLMEIVGDPIE